MSKNIKSNADVWRILQDVAEKPELQSIAEAASVLGKPGTREEGLLQQFAYQFLAALGTAFDEHDRLDVSERERASLIHVLSDQLLSGVPALQDQALQRFAAYLRKRRADTAAYLARYRQLTEQMHEGAV